MKIKQILMSNKRLLKYIGVLFTVAFGFLYAMYYVENRDKYGEWGYTPDEGNYISMAKRLLAGGPYSYWGNEPDAYVSPGYPVFLTLCMSVFGTDIKGIYYIKIVQALLFAAIVFLTFLLGYLLTKKYSVGLIASIFISVNGTFCFYSRFLLTETFYFFTLILSFVIAVLTFEKNKMYLHFLLGISFCVCVMVRPLVFVTIPIIYFLLFIQQRKEWKKVAFAFMLFAIGFVIVALPWWIRNIITLNKFVLFATQTNPIYAGLAKDVEEIGLKDPGTMLGNIKLLFTLLKEDFLGTINWMIFGKFNIMFMGKSSAPYFVIISTLIKNITVYVGLLGAVSSLFVKKTRWFAIVFIIFLLSSFMFIPTSRYSLQYMPFLAIFMGIIVNKSFTCSHKEIERR